MLVLDVSQSGKAEVYSTIVNSKRRLDGGLINEERGAGSPVGAGAGESASLRLLEPGRFQFASLEAAAART